jgi:anaerobic ribonucleoside-triphosphate reductase activating protein
MNYAEIKPYSIENGTGVRVSLFVAGCRHHCKGCFNEETWDFAYGCPFTEETEQQIMEMLSPAYVKGLTLLGGDPTEPENQEALLPLLRRVRTELPDKTVWTYSGYLYEDFLPGGRAYCEATEEYLSLIDIMVDGPFIMEKKNIMLRFRGSENQRIINVKKTRQTGNIVLEME